MDTRTNDTPTRQPKSHWKPIEPQMEMRQMTERGKQRDGVVGGSPPSRTLTSALRSASRMKQDQPSPAQLLQLCTEERRGTSQEGGGNSRERRNRKSADRLRVMFSRESLLLPPPPPTRHSTHTRLFASSASSFSTSPPQIPIQFQVD